MATARRQIAAARRWWMSNRYKAPSALDDELDAVIALIAESPLIGMRVRARRRGIRRLTMPITHYYVYYCEAPDDTIEVLALWHSSRRPPSL